MTRQTKTIMSGAIFLRNGAASQACGDCDSLIPAAMDSSCGKRSRFSPRAQVTVSPPGGNASCCSGPLEVSLVLSVW